MALEATPVYRNLGTRVTFLGLEAEDLFAILALAVVSNLLVSRRATAQRGRKPSAYWQTAASRCCTPSPG